MSRTVRKPLLRRQLEAIGADLVKKLDGKWHGNQGMCRCPIHEDRVPSLSVRVGETNLLFHCFAGCDTGRILRWIYRAAPESLSSAEASPAPIPDKTAWLRKRAEALWQEAVPLDGTPAERYLQARAICHRSEALRYHASTPLGRGPHAIRRPALLARVEDQNGLLAVQRTFLDARLARRARDLSNPRRLLGQPGRGAVRLFQPFDLLGLAEGVETAMSAAALLQIPVWAVLGNERFPHIAIPPSVTRLILLPDNDRAGRRGAAAACAALGSDMKVETLLPWSGRNDWNDVLRSIVKARTREVAVSKEFGRPEAGPVQCLFGRREGR